MKTLVLLAGMLVGFAAWAQAEKPAPAPQDAAQEEAAKSPPPKMASRKPNPKRFEDARHCLERPTNVEIIKCSEEYL
jgi:hypothetical protein